MIQNSLLDRHRSHIEKWLHEHKSYTQVAVLIATTYGIPTTERSVRRAARRWGITPGKGPDKPERETLKVSAEAAEFTTAPRPEADDIEELIRERGLDPDDWEQHSVTVNKWDSPSGEPLKQLKVHLKRAKVIIPVAPANVSLGRVFRSSVFLPDETEPELVVFVGDQHAPYHDTDLHLRFCAFLADQRPDRGILMGDLIDLSTISRHPLEPDWAAPVQECLDTGCQVLLDYLESSEETTWVKLPGNHLERLRRSVIDRLGEMYGLTPANVETMPNLRAFHDPVYLLRLDELGITYVKPRGSYKQAQYAVTQHLAAKHGETARKGSGASALTALDGLDHSVIIGHTHRQSMVQRTVQQIDRSARLLQASETGCMCRIEQGLGYAPGPDWSNGFITASIWPDGTFKLDLATYVDNRLYWRDQRY